MKNFSLIEVPVDGIPSWQLIGNDGQAVLAFDMFAEAFRKRNPYNTRRNYCLNLTRFLDYLTEAEKVSPTWDQKRLAALVDAYPDWIMLGV
jgi:hypothetical protein